MPIPHRVRRATTLLVTASFAVAPFAPAQAAMVGTAEVLATQTAPADRARLAALLERQDLQRQLAVLGVDATDARARIARLTDAEVAQLNQRIDALPAGADSVLGVLLLAFLILVITDALGVTDVFPFVHPAR